jgi:hypothetical protein
LHARPLATVLLVENLEKLNFKRTQKERERERIQVRSAQSVRILGNHECEKVRVIIFLMQVAALRISERS